MFWQWLSLSLGASFKLASFFSAFFREHFFRPGTILYSPPLASFCLFPFKSAHGSLFPFPKCHFCHFARRDFSRSHRERERAKTETGRKEAENKGYKFGLPGAPLDPTDLKFIYKLSLSYNKYQTNYICKIWRSSHIFVGWHLWKMTPCEYSPHYPRTNSCLAIFFPAVSLSPFLPQLFCCVPVWHPTQCLRNIKAALNKASLLSSLHNKGRGWAGESEVKPEFISVRIRGRAFGPQKTLGGTKLCFEGGYPPWRAG